VEAVSFCAKRKMKLAHFEDYCAQNSEGVFTVSPRVAPGDQWAPFAGGQENSWVQIGNGASTKNPVEPCKTYEQAFGDKPAWGMDGKPYRYKSFMACKASYGFIPYSSDRGQGKCETGAVIPHSNVAKTEYACKMHCAKEGSCKFASWTATDQDGVCTLLSTCDSWTPSAASMTWIRKPLR